VVAKVSLGGMTGRGECVPYSRYGETPEATLVALKAAREPLRAEAAAHPRTEPAPVPYGYMRGQNVMSTRTVHSGLPVGRS